MYNLNEQVLNIIIRFVRELSEYKNTPIALIARNRVKKAEINISVIKIKSIKTNKKCRRSSVALKTPEIDDILLSQKSL
jgi:hypothetical protein